MADSVANLSKDSCKEFLQCGKFWKWLVFGTIAVKISSKLIRAGHRFVVNKLADIPPREIKHEKDVVYLYMFPRAIYKGAPNVSPYSVKVETWLRMNNIKYEAIETTRQSPTTRQFPYIIFNGQEHSESEAIISLLSKHFDIDNETGFSPEEWAISRAMCKLVDEDLSWTYFVHRYVHDIKTFTQILKHPTNGPQFVVNAVTKQLNDWVTQRAFMQGVGRYPPSEVAQRGKDDLRALSKYLGKKEFLMGNKPSKVDCSVFGHLSQVVYADFPFAHKEILDTECRNIMPYMERMKRRYWPDWDELVPVGHFR